LITLAIESTSKSVSVALLSGAKSILQIDSKEDRLNNDSASSERIQAGSEDKLPAGFVRKRSKGGSKTSRVFPPGASVLLAPMIKSLFSQTGYSIKDTNLIGIAIGPGLFTGIRVGVVTAKTLAYSIGAEVVGINTLDAIAEKTKVTLGGTLEATAHIRPIVNAQRQQVFAGHYQLEQNELKPFEPNEVIDREQWIKTLNPGDVVTGAGLRPIEEAVGLKPGVVIAPKSCWDCCATTIGQLAEKKFESGYRDSLWDLEPLYFRPSAAEEVRAAKLAAESKLSN
jgi:tRNA threonylcarbamoyladenosine biosynthesis protein TsaB